MDSKVKVVKIVDLKLAAHNPPNRSKNIGQLKKSIEDIGLQYPILVSEKNEVIDGHRRIRAYEEMGLEEIPVIVTKTNIDRAYAEVNATSRHMSGNDVLHIYFSKPEALQPSAMNRCARAVAVLGDVLVKRIMNAGNTLRVYSVARKVSTYCDRDDDKFTRQVTRWILDNGYHVIESAVSMGVPPATIIKAVKNKIQLKHSFTTD